jgi:general secretion pathway protein G
MVGLTAMRHRNNTLWRRARNRSGVSGFTLLELAIVITIIIILATIGAGRYQQAVVKAHEAALRQDLSEMRTAIQNYTKDKEAAPSSLEDLKDAQYLREIPTDPITREKNWNAETCDQLFSVDQQVTGICDVHSASEETSPFEASPYSSW